ARPGSAAGGGRRRAGEPSAAVARMPRWPRIDEPELLERLALDDAQFAAYIASLVAALPPRPYEGAALSRALRYPWARPPGSYVLNGGQITLLAAMPPGRRDDEIERFSAAEAGRVPLLAIGSNAAPAVLERKFAHFEEAADRAALVLTGRLHGF